MHRQKHTLGGVAVTRLILEVFRLNGRLIDAGDGLVADVDLTSARWQVLGAISSSPVPLSVAHIARNMGLARQGVQRIVDILEQIGLVRFARNPHHERAKLVMLTANGRRAFADAMARQVPWANALARSLDTAELVAALRVLATLRERLDPKPRSLS